MKALVFRYSFPRFAFATVAGKIYPPAYLGPGSPMSLESIPEPALPADDWILVRTELCGICGSDIKQVFLDGNFDNPLTAFVSFPQVLGHEVVGEIQQIGAGVKNRQVGERVVLNPWLPCATRGIDPPCSACQDGHYYVCDHFTDGTLSRGMHIGNNREATGGYAPLFAAHETQLFPIPDSVSFEEAVLADPFSVSLHAVLKAPPEDGNLVVVYGCGTLGLLTVALLKVLYPTVDILAIARYQHQAELARWFGAKYCIQTRKPVEIIEQIADIVGTRVYRPWKGKPMLMRGAQRIYDTVGSPETLEVGIRVAQPLAKLVITGVANPARFEWTPLYFKEIEVVGSNAFGIESFQGRRRHAMEIYLDLLEEKRFDFTRLITHRFRIEQYRQAFLAAHMKSSSAAVKVVFAYDGMR
jgi:threonine dehydrogenase-like Zn-dependent dehydrogenase